MACFIQLCVKYTVVQRADGSIERHRRIVTHGQVSDEARSLLDEGIIPPGVCVADHRHVAIYPYVYLFNESYTPAAKGSGIFKAKAGAPTMML